MLTADRVAEDSDAGPARETYGELARAHAQRLYELAVLLLERPDVALTVSQDALRRTWGSLEKDDLFVEPEEMVYRAVVREAARRLARAGARGYQAPTTGDERHINAVGVVERFVPDQRAAVLLAIRMQTGYRFAATVTGLGEGRVRDLCFAARQEYAEAGRHGAPTAAACPSYLPQLSARADGQITAGEVEALDGHLAGCAGCEAALAVYEDFGAALRELRLPLPERDALELALDIPVSRPQATGSKRLLQLARGPAFLVVLLVAGLYVFRLFTPAPVETGVGRTPDLIYARAREGNETLVMDSGNGRELGRLPAGTLDAQGWHVYAAASTCDGATCRTALRITDTATGETRSVGSLPGRLEVVAADPSRQRVYLSDAAEGWNRLLAIDAESGSAAGSVSAPTAIEETFQPQRTALAAAAPVLFTLGRASGGELTLVRTDLDALSATAIQTVVGQPETGMMIVAARDGSRAFVYFPAGPALHEVDASGRTQSTDLRSSHIRPGEGFVPSGGEIVALAPDGRSLYCLIPSGGIAVVQNDPLTLLRVVVPDQRFRSLGSSTDGRLLYGLGFDGTYHVIDPSSGALVFSRPGVRAADLLQVDIGE